MSAQHDVVQRAPVNDAGSHQVGERRALTVNGGPVETAAASLADLLLELGYGGQRVATAVNGDFIAERQRQTVSLAAGDRIEVVAARQGG